MVDMVSKGDANKEKKRKLLEPGKHFLQKKPYFEENV